MSNFLSYDNIVKVVIAAILFCAPQSCAHNPKNEKSAFKMNTASDSTNYLGQKAPTTTPEIFAPGLISKPNEYEFGSVFNKDVKEFFYGVVVKVKSEIRYSRFIDGRWTQPEVLLSAKNYGFNDPFLSPDENKLYFISQMPKDKAKISNNYDIWYVNRLESGWSSPMNAGENINSESNEYYISFNSDGTMYFASDKSDKNFDVYKSDLQNGNFQNAYKLSDAINSPHYEADVFIDPDEEFIIFCAERPEGYGRGDLYISFKDQEGNWTKARNMGERINTTGHELCPFVSKDGKYLFFTSYEDIYWVSMDAINEM